MLKAPLSAETALLIVGFLFIIYGMGVGISTHNPHVMWFTAAGLGLVIFARWSAAKKAKSSQA